LRIKRQINTIYSRFAYELPQPYTLSPTHPECGPVASSDTLTVANLGFGVDHMQCAFSDVTENVIEINNLDYLLMDLTVELDNYYFPGYWKHDSFLYQQTCQFGD
jgi:hypothetical protein